MRIPHLLILPLIGIGCEPFFDPDIGEGEGEFDGIPEEQVHDLADPLPVRPELEFLDLRIQDLRRPERVELRTEAEIVLLEVLAPDLVLLHIDGRAVDAELEPEGDGWRVFGLVEWVFSDGIPVEAVVTAEARLR